MRRVVIKPKELKSALTGLYEPSKAFIEIQYGPLHPELSFPLHFG